MNPELVDYIRENRGRYTRDAITRHLVGAGHAPDDVEAAWAAVEAETAPAELPPSDDRGTPADGSEARPPTPARRSVRREPLFYLTAIGFVVVYLGGGALLGTVASDHLGIAAGFILLAPLAALVTSVVLLVTNRARSVAWGLLAGIVLLALLIFIGVVIVAGICVAYIVKESNP